jgi:UDP-3-O-[3-hydroxymyristoyl] glucosamine N-acyltransferase
LKLQALAEQLQLSVKGDVDVEIHGIAGLQDAGPGQLTFLFNSSYRDMLASSAAAAVVLREADAGLTDKPVIIADNPRLAWARVAALFDPAPVTMPFVEASACVSDLAEIGKGVFIGEQAVVRPGAEIGDGARIGAGSYIGDGVVIGAGTRIMPGVVIYHDVVIGTDCIIHANSVIGADGFGFEFDADSGDYVKIPQIYGVRIGSHVEIGAGTTIDRGALNDTLIGDHCKFDNQVQVGHGTRVDHHTVISGCTAIAGSTKIGAYCLIGGAVGIVDNIEIVDQVEITAMTLVSQSILEKGRYSSGTGLMRGNEWKRSIVGFRKLDEMLKRLRRLESKAD